MTPTRCVYWNCRNTSKNFSLFRFPTGNASRLADWINNCGNMTITHLNLQDLRNRYLCISHFDDKFIMNKNGKRKRLTKLAVPQHFQDEPVWDTTPRSPCSSDSEGSVLNMTMEKLKKCRICLMENVRMYLVANKDLHEIYERLTYVPFVTEDSKPLLACFFCCAKLKQCYRFQKKCLKAEELFTQMLKEGYQKKDLTNQGLSEFCSGFTISPTVHVSIDDKCQTESTAIKEELPAVCEVLDVIIEPNEEYRSDEPELENLDNSCVDVADISPHHSESDLEDGVPLMEFKTNVEEEQEVSKKEPTASEMTRPEDLDNSCLDIADISPQASEAEIEDDILLMEFKTEVEEEQEVSKKEPRASESDKATVAKKPKLDTPRTEPEDATTAERTRNEKSDPNVTSWATQTLSFKPSTYFKKPCKCYQPRFKSVKK